MFGFSLTKKLCVVFNLLIFTDAFACVGSWKWDTKKQFFSFLRDLYEKNYSDGPFMDVDPIA